LTGEIRLLKLKGCTWSLTKFIKAKTAHFDSQWRAIPNLRAGMARYTSTACWNISQHACPM